MRISDLILTEKHIDLLNDDSQVIFAEGVTNSGKSLILGVKFFQKVMSSPENHKQFVIAGTSTPVLEKMFIQNEASFYNMFKPLCSYNAAGTGGAKITVRTATGDKFIYLVGYDNSRRWKDILGMKINGFLVEEINTAHDDFIGELFLRTFRNNGFLYCSSNGADDTLKVYVDYLDKGRPLEKYSEEIPDSTWSKLEEQTPNPKFRYYFFTFKDNPDMTPQEVATLFDAIPEGSWEHKTKLLGERGMREGVIFAPYMTKAKNIVKYSELVQDGTSKYTFIRYTIGIDVGSTDYTIFSLIGYTNNYKEAIVLDWFKINKAGTDEIYEKFRTWWTPYHNEIRSKLFGAFIDSAAPIVRDSLAPKLLSEFNIRIASAYKYSIRERCDFGVRLLHAGRLLFSDRATELYDSFTKAYYKKDKESSDPRAFRNHLDKDKVDSVEYGLSPFITNIITR